MTSVIRLFLFGLAAGALPVAGAPPAAAVPAPPNPAVPPPAVVGPVVGEGPQSDPVFDEITFRDMDLRDALAVLSEESGYNLAASTEAAKNKVSVQLRNVTAMSAVQVICQTHGLYFRKRPEDGVGVVTTAKEFQDGLTIFRDEKTKVFTLLYPNALDLAVAIRDLYGPRVQLSLGKEAIADDSEEVQRRFSTFDLLDQRAQGLGLTSTGSGGGNGGGGNGGGGNGGGNRGGATIGGGARGGGSGLSLGSAGTGVPQQFTQPERLQNLTDEERRYVEETAVKKDGGLRVVDVDRIPVRRSATNIYVSVVRRNNQVLVRTSDSQVMEEIEKLREKLDVPTPQVLLEVKVLSVDLTDGFRSVFDLQFSDRKNSASFASGNVLPPPGLAGVNDRTGIGLQVGGLGLAPPSPFGLDPSSLIYQFVDNNFRLRMQLLEDRNKVTVLATPVLLAANNEVSRLFIGEERPIVRNITSNVAVAGNLGGSVVGGGTANIDFRPVGTTLLITPQINADRTVTLRILQENSLIVTGGASIPVIAADGTVTNQPVDVVSSRTLTGTLVAKDGLSLAMGGLIEEGLNDQREQVPFVGRLPVLGFFFRRQATGRYRRELIIVVRPYVLSTPVEGEALSRRLSDSLALHPKSGELYPPEGRPIGPLGTYKAHEVLRPNPPANKLQGLLQLHAVLPLDF